MSELVGGAEGAYDTLVDIQNLMQSDAGNLISNIATINSSLALKASLSDLSNGLVSKADASDVVSSLALKANASDVASLAYVDGHFIVYDSLFSGLSLTQIQKLREFALS